MITLPMVYVQFYSYVHIYMVYLHIRDVESNLFSRTICS